MSFFETFWIYLIRSAPYLMFGLLLSGIVQQFITIDFVRRNLGKNSFLSILKAAIIGIPLPLCSCSVIPTSITLKKSGASNGATSAFLIATPESGIDSILMTYALMDIPMTILRPVAAFFSALTAGILQFKFNPSPEISPATRGDREEGEREKCCPEKSGPQRLRKKAYSVLHYGFYSLLKDIALWLTVGLVLGAIIMHFVPENLFFQLSATQGKLLVLVVSIPFYICASATTPIAAALMLKGMSPGTALLLLLLGPATNISNLIVLQKYIGKRGVLINVFAITIVALALSSLTDFLYQFFAWTPDIRLGLVHAHGGDQGVLSTTLTILFVVLLLNALWAELFSQNAKHKAL